MSVSRVAVNCTLYKALVYDSVIYDLFFLSTVGGAAAARSVRPSQLSSVQMHFSFHPQGPAIRELQETPGMNIVQAPYTYWKSHIVY